MKFFPRKRDDCQTSPTYPPYWSEWEFGQLTEELTRDDPYLRFDVTAVSYGMKFGNRSYSEDIDRNLEFRGTLGSPKAAFKCEVSVNPDEFIDHEYHGYLVLETYLPNRDDPHSWHPVISARFYVRSTEHLELFRRTLQAGISPFYTASVGFSLKSIENIDNWKSEFESRHYSPSIVIEGANVSTSVNQVPWPR